MALASSRVTATSQTTQSILDYTKTRLEATTDMGVDEVEWSVELFPGTEAGELFEFIPQLGLPCAVVMYASASDWEDKPQRTLPVSVVVACEAFNIAANTTLSGLIDQAVALVDRQIQNQAVWEIRSDIPVDLRPGIAASLLTFEVKDFGPRGRTAYTLVDDESNTLVDDEGNSLVHYA